MKRIIIFFLMVLLSKYAIAGNELNKKELEWLKSNSEVSELGCDKFEKYKYSKHKALMTEKAIFIDNKSVFKNKIYDNGILVCEISIGDPESIASSNENNYKNIIKLKERLIIGNTKADIYLNSGYGTIGKIGVVDDDSKKKSWVTSCNVNIMSDELMCKLYNDGFSIFRTEDGYTIKVSGTNSSALIRLDKDKPVESNEDGIFSNDVSDEIVSRLMHTSKLIIKYIPETSRMAKYKYIDISDFKIAKETLDKLYTNYKS